MGWLIPPPGASEGLLNFYTMMHIGIFFGFIGVLALIAFCVGVKYYR